MLPRNKIQWHKHCLNIETLSREKMRVMRLTRKTPVKRYVRVDIISRSPIVLTSFSSVLLVTILSFYVCVVFRRLSFVFLHSRLFYALKDLLTYLLTYLGRS